MEATRPPPPRSFWYRFQIPYAANDCKEWYRYGWWRDRRGQSRVKDGEEWEYVIRGRGEGRRQTVITIRTRKDLDHKRHGTRTLQDGDLGSIVHPGPTPQWENRPKETVVKMRSGSEDRVQSLVEQISTIILIIKHHSCEVYSMWEKCLAIHILCMITDIHLPIYFTLCMYVTLR